MLIFPLLAIFSGTSCASRQPIVEAQSNQKTNINNATQNVNNSRSLDNSSSDEKPKIVRTIIPMTKDELSPKMRALLSPSTKSSSLNDDWYNKYLDQHPDIKYNQISVGGNDYIFESRTGKLIGKIKAEPLNNGKIPKEFCGDYAEIFTTSLNEQLEDIMQGGMEIMKFNGKSWETIATSELDYNCKDIRSIPKKVRECLEIECY